jgi:hypothetical protein
MATGTEQMSQPGMVKIKAAVRERDGHKCTNCGMSNDLHRERWGTGVEVHRLVPGSLYSLEGCVTLCKTCHGKQPRKPRFAFDHAHGISGESNVMLRFTDDLMESSEAYLNAQIVRPKRNTLILTALRAFLAERGYPPRPKS